MLKLSRQHGFSLIELIGVLAIISILAAVIVPNMVKRIDLAMGDAESKNLSALAQELELFTTTKFSIPGSASWAAPLATISALPTSKILMNERGFQRGFYVDPRFLTTTDVVFSGYTQNVGLLTAPVSPRIMLVSNLKANAPAAPTSSAAFDAIWNQSNASTLIENDDIKIHRVYLGHLFHQLLLLNRHTVAPAYQLANGTLTPIPVMAGGIDGQSSIFVLHGTQLNLHQAPFPTGASQYTLFIHERDSFLYGTNGATWFWGRP